MANGVTETIAVSMLVMAEFPEAVMGFRESIAEGDAVAEATINSMTDAVGRKPAVVDGVVDP